jgi:hypothetical protein
LAPRPGREVAGGRNIRERTQKRGEEVTADATVLAKRAPHAWEVASEAPAEIGAARTRTPASSGLHVGRPALGRVGRRGRPFLLRRLVRRHQRDRRRDRAGPRIGSDQKQLGVRPDSRRRAVGRARGRVLAPARMGLLADPTGSGGSQTLRRRGPRRRGDCRSVHGGIRRTDDCPPPSRRPQQQSGRPRRRAHRRRGAVRLAAHRRGADPRHTRRAPMGARPGLVDPPGWGDRAGIQGAAHHPHDPDHLGRGSRPPSGPHTSRRTQS